MVADEAERDQIAASGTLQLRPGQADPDALFACAPFQHMCIRQVARDRGRSTDAERARPLGMHTRHAKHEKAVGRPSGSPLPADRL